MATCGLSGGLLNAPFFKPLKYIPKFNVTETIFKKFPSTHDVFPAISCLYVPVKGSRLAIVWDSIGSYSNGIYIIIHWMGKRALGLSRQASTFEFFACPVGALKDKRCGVTITLPPLPSTYNC